jgi:long-chain acyl-CoA synthetase
MLSHGNIVAEVAAVKCSDFKMEARDVHISYLPLAHLFERLILTSCYFFGF